MFSGATLSVASARIASKLPRCAPSSSAPRRSCFTRDQVFLAGARDRERAVLAQREEQPVERDVREAKEVRVDGAEAVRLPEAR